jgi:hypothetical protein
MDEETPRWDDHGSKATDLTALGGAEMAELLSRIPGAWERVDAGIEQARRGETIPLDQLELT